MSIQRLAYRVEKAGAFADDVIEFSHAVGDFSLANGLLRVDLRLPTDSISEARAHIDPVVRAWEFEAEIRMGFPVIKFEFTPAVAVGATSQRSPETNGATELVIATRYPPAPTIAVTSEMENVWERYTRARLGIGESVESAVYYGLTVIEAQFGSRPKAAAALNLPHGVLSKLGELSSTRGDAATARKSRASGEPLNRSEKKWIDHSIRYALLQLGHLAAGLAPPEIEAGALPDLE
ncbi:hypothetical protein MYXO_00885 [Myxococcaceae bacterium]|nr:hypothetical protein MYXO_00885 [Myxococcaceae bacterium]